MARPGTSDRLIAGNRRRGVLPAHHDFLGTHCWVEQTRTAGVLFAQWPDRDERPLVPLVDSFQRGMHTDRRSGLGRFLELINPYREGVVRHL